VIDVVSLFVEIVVVVVGLELLFVDIVVEVEETAESWFVDIVVVVVVEKSKKMNNIN
jgi:hypothetical protein